MTSSTTTLSVLAALLLACSGSSSSSGGGGAPVEIRAGKTGAITVLQSQSLGLGGTSLQTGASAFFYASYTAALRPSCTTEGYGSCQVTVCASPSDSSGVYVPADAGTLTLHGLSGGDVVLPATSNGYDSFDSQLGSFTAGTRVDVSAVGNSAGAPAFSLSAVGPDDLVFSQPVFDPDFQIAHVASGSDLALAWTPIANGQAQANMTAAPDGHLTHVTCTFDGSAGSASIPASVIAELGPAGGSFGLSVLTSTVQTVDDWQITLTLQTPAYGPGKTAFAGGTLEID